jgi:hypothetical protein
MVIARCAWHQFFCGYPRPVRVVSWRGPRISFTETICRSCERRVRDEALWLPSPPTPVWPGSAHTAAILVGLPLLAALLLIATPLHEATHDSGGNPPPPLTAELEDETHATTVSPAARPATVPRARQVKPAPVPAVIYEMRREISAFPRATTSASFAHGAVAPQSRSETQSP